MKENNILNMKQEQNYLFEVNRINSFKMWPFDNKKPCNILKLAEAGFFWCGNDTEIDSVACFLCDKVLDGWEEEDDPWAEHLRHAPQCTFVKFQRSENDLTLDEFLTIMKKYNEQELEKKYKKKVNKLKIDREAIVKKLNVKE